MQREQWNTQMGFLLAAIGSAIGLGNIWRFSYLAYEHGGGAFLIPYLTALLTAGIPLLILEYGIGHERIGSAPLAYRKIAKSWEWLGWWSVIFVMFGIELYYSVIIAWCLNYFAFSFDLKWGANPDTFFFQDFLKISQDPSDIGEIRTPILFSLLIIWFINWAVIYRGVQRGIEAVNKLLMPMLLILTLVLVFWSLQLEGAWQGIKTYITPDFSKLTTPKVWIDAYSQIFFTLSLGFGIMITYASYLPDKTNITRNAILIALINSGYSLLTGFGVFAVLGFMAHIEGKAIADVITQSIGLAFVAYPKAISMMPGGNMFGALFFLCLTVAGLSSAVSILEAFVSAIIDKFNINRRLLVTFTAVIGCTGSIIFTTQAGLLWLDIVDHFITHYGLVVVGVLECIVISHIFSIQKLQKHINTISSFKLGFVWRFLVSYFIPFMLAVVLVGDIYTELQQPYSGYSWTALILIGRDWLLLTLIAAFFTASRPWKTELHKKSSRKIS